MKRVKVALLFIALVLLVSACGKDGKPSNENSGGQDENMLVSETVEVKAQSLPADIAAFTEVTSYVGDTDADGIDEKVVLATSAERDNKGEFLWNDGQNWALYVEESPSEVYVLFNKFVQAGNVYFDVSDYYLKDGTKPKILVMASMSAGLSIKNFTFDNKKSAYIEEVVYDTQEITEGGINKRFSSVPEIID